MNHAAAFILHIPHASRFIPGEVRPAIVLSDQELEAELLRMTDAYTDTLYAPPDGRFTAVQFPFSRLVVDPERFPDDAAEPMVSRGMGVIYTHTSQGKRLRNPPTPQGREHYLQSYYWPHHRRLESAVDDALTAHGRACIVDCHSFPARPSPYELHQSPDRPDICIGTDAYHTPRELFDRIMEQFQGYGFSIEVDRPFAGALVPLSRYQKDRRVASIMIEYNRRLYMDETTGARNASFGELTRITHEVLTALAPAFDG